MKIFVWGAGFAAKELLENELASVQIDAFIDKKVKELGKYVVYSPEEAVDLEYDAIVVGTGSAQDVYRQAKELGYDLSKFIFVYNNYIYNDMNVDYDLADKIFGKKYSEIIRTRYHVIRGMLIDEIRTPNVLLRGGG